MWERAVSLDLAGSGVVWIWPDLSVWVRWDWTRGFGEMEIELGMGMGRGMEMEMEMDGVGCGGIDWGGMSNRYAG